jgi:hypothetical protein
MMDEIDLKLQALLRTPDRPEDGQFAERVHRRVLAEQRLADVRRKGWRRFALETAASAAILAAFILLARAAPGEGGSDFVPLFSPAMLGLVVLGLWLAVAARPSPGFR